MTTLQFNDIPSTTLSPFTWVEFNASNARPVPTTQPYKLLCIGQLLAAGTVDEKIPTIVRSKSDGRAFFGEGSMLAQLLERVFDNQQSIEVTALGLSDAGGATQTVIKVTVPIATTTAGGTIFAYIGGRRIVANVASGSDEDAQALALVTAINAGSDLGVIAAVDGVNSNEANLTLRNGGSLGDEFDVRFNHFQGEAFPPGALAYTVAIDTAGSGDPVIDASVWSPLADTHYNVIAFGQTDTAALAALATELDDRFLPTRSIGAIALTAKQDTHANLVTLADGRNSDRFTVMMGYNNGPAPPWEWAGAIGGNVAFSAAADAARPFQNLQLKGLLGLDAVDEFTLQEKEAALIVGLATYNIRPDGNLSIGRLVTFYEQDDLGSPDDTYRDANTTLTLEFFRWSLRTTIQSKFARHKLLDDGRQIPAGQPIVTPEVMQMQILALGRQWEQLGLLENFDDFRDAIVVERTPELDPNRLDIRIRPDLVNQFRVSRTSIEFVL